MKKNLEIVKVNESYAIRNIDSKNYLIPWGIKSREEAEEIMARLEKESE